MTMPERVQGCVHALRAVGAERTRHGGGSRSLLDHLVGTWSLLRRANEREAVQLAGLFHSIYGTNIFRVATLRADDPAHRAAVQTLIGEEAESLVFLFCTCPDRPDGIIGRGRLRHEREYSPAVWRDLAAIELANLIDQGGAGMARSYLRANQHGPNQVVDHMRDDRSDERSAPFPQCCEHEAHGADHRDGDPALPVDESE